MQSKRGWEERGSFFGVHFLARCIQCNLLTHVEPPSSRSVRASTPSLSLSLFVHKASGASPPPLPLLLRPHVHTPTRSRGRAMRADKCIVDFEPRSIKPHRRARAPSDFSRGLIGSCTGPRVRQSDRVVDKLRPIYVGRPHGPW